MGSRENNMGKALDLTGNVFGRLTVTGMNPERTFCGGIRWDSVCACGKKTTSPGSNLVSGKTINCGCYHAEQNKKASTIHGMWKSIEFSVWTGMRSRCYNEKHKQYADYGGRGITMCDAWKDNFQAFYDDMGPRPSLDYTIDRIDNDVGYCKENCKWSTKLEQANNKRNNVFYKIGNVSRTLAGWSRELNFNYKSVHSLMKHHGIGTEASAAQAAQGSFCDVQDPSGSQA